MRPIVKEMGGKYKQGPVKLKKGKWFRDNGGTISHVCDVVRSTAIFESMAQLARAIDWLRSEQCDLAIVFAKDRYNHPASGYQDLLLNLRLKGDEYTHTAELQLMLQATADLKPNSHRTYALTRLFDGWGWEEEGFSPGESVEVNTGVHVLRPATVVKVALAENGHDVETIDVRFNDGSRERAEAVDLVLIDQPKEHYSRGDKVQVQSGDMVYRRAQVISFYPGSGWPAYTPGTLDVTYGDTKEVCGSISEKLVRVDRNAVDDEEEDNRSPYLQLMTSVGGEGAAGQEERVPGQGSQQAEDGAPSRAERETSRRADLVKTRAKKGQVVPEILHTTLPPLRR